MPSPLARLAIAFLVVLASCKKEHSLTGGPQPEPRLPKVLLKDIIVPRLPSPYYHFEYGPDSNVVKASFDSDLTQYDVLYNGNKISEMRNNIIVNHDTLRYFYDPAGRIEAISFIRDNGILYRHASFRYNGSLPAEIAWDHLEADGHFHNDRTLSFTFWADGNLKQVTEHRPAANGLPETSYTTAFEGYDDKRNVDDFMLWHDGIHDHLFLVPGLRLQKNNPRREVRTGDGVNYTVDYTYTYRPDNTPVLKSGDLLFTTGAQAGQHFAVSTNYSYY